MRIAVSTATDADMPEWRRFVAGREDAHFAHEWLWRDVLQETFGQAAHYLMARDPDGAIAGILPLVHVRSLLFGSSLVSMPYLNGGGIMASSPEAAAALLERAQALVEELGVGYLELRHRAPQPALEPTLPVRSHKMVMSLPLAPDADGLMKSFKTKIRTKVRRSWRDEGQVQVQAVHGEAATPELIDAFYRVFARNMRDLGTPVYPRRLFAVTLGAFGQRARLIVVFQQGQPVAGGITIGFRGRVEIPWASALRNVPDGRHNNVLLYWHAMLGGCEDGYRVFDFGRSSPGSGPYEFKQQWGPTTEPLYWYYAKGRGDIPDVNPASPKFALLVECWRHMPLPLANAMGPILTRSLP